VHVAMFHVPNRPNLKMITTYMIITSMTISIITRRKDVRHVACQTSAHTHHINILARTMMSFLPATHHGKVICIHLT
jgi:hypothetical protein